MNEVRARECCALVLRTFVVLIALVGSARAQGMSFSVYSDADTSSDEQSLYFYSDGDDNSWGCNHGSYSTNATVYSPSNRTSSYEQSGLNGFTSLALDSEYGDYTFSVLTSYHCSCMGPPGGGGGTAYFGGGEPIAVLGWFNRVKISNPQTTEGCDFNLTRYDAYNCTHECAAQVKCFPPISNNYEGIGAKVAGHCSPGVWYPVSQTGLCKAPDDPEPF